MSAMTVSKAMDRIRDASSDSPIAVFFSPIPGTIDVVFANTAQTKRWIDKGTPKLIGIYHGQMGLHGVREKLNKSIHY